MLACAKKSEKAASGRPVFQTLRERALSESLAIHCELPLSPCASSLLSPTLWCWPQCRSHLRSTTDSLLAVSPCVSCISEFPRRRGQASQRKGAELQIDGTSLSWWIAAVLCVPACSVSQPAIVSLALSGTGSNQNCLHEDLLRNQLLSKARWRSHSCCCCCSCSTPLIIISSRCQFLVFPVVILLE